MHIFTPLTSPRYSVALLLLRVVVGLAFVLHGLPKIQDPLHWDDLGPMPGVSSWLQAASALAEFGGGILLIVGFLTPMAALFVGILGFHVPHGGRFVGGPGAFELPLTFLVVMIVLLMLGPGAYSIDALVFKRRIVSSYRR
jgi:putative oxidoreductase